MKKLLLTVLFLVSCVLGSAAQSTAIPSSPDSLEKMLAAKEKQKWEALTNGRWLALKDMFTDDYLSIGYPPGGTVRMTTKAESFSQENRLPPGVEFVLSDFKIISADKKSVVLTYRAAGPIKIHATSVWTKRGKEWKTIFYQATMTR